MKTFLFCCSFFLTVGFQCFYANDVNEMMPSYYLVSDTVNPNLSKTEAVFRFHVSNGSVMSPKEHLKISINGIWKKVTLDKNDGFDIKVQPGVFSFQFFWNKEHYEITTGSITIEPKHVQVLEIYFESTNDHITVKKPVIYFHSAIDLPVEVMVKPTNDFVFTYPTSDGTWNGMVKASGGIDVAGTHYPYLFWESSQQYAFKSAGNGFKVEKADVISFLTKKLTELGLNQQEQTDFITFWGPAMAKNESSFVQFSIDEACNDFANMNCSPKPEATRRVYIQISKWDPSFEKFLKDLSFNSFTPSGFYIVEWGGFEFQPINL